MRCTWVTGYTVPCLITIAVTVALVAWQVVQLKKNSDPARQRRNKRNIALFLLIRVAAFIVMLIPFYFALLAVI